MRRRNVRWALTLLVAGLLTTSTVAWGYVTSTPAAGGSGAAQATTVAQGATPSGSVSGSSVTVTWAATTLANGAPVGGYLVRRYHATTLVVQTILSACTGTLTTTSCTETNVPPGSWRYAVTPLVGTSWRGAESVKSNPVTVPDTIAPSSSITLTSITGGAALTGTTAYYRGVAAGSFRLTNAVTDPHSGPASSQTVALSGTVTGWTHTPSTVSTPAAGPYVSNTFDWAAATTSSPQEVVTARDVAGNAGSTTLTFTNDSTAPSATVTYSAGNPAGRSVSVTLSASDTGSGLQSRQLQRAQSTLSGGICGTFGVFSNVGTANPASPYNDVNLSNGACYKYQYVVIDRVGNQTIATNANLVQVDYTAAVSATAGLVSYWRLGEGAATATASDSFTGTAGAQVNARAGDVGSWAFHAGNLSTLEQISSEGRAYRNGAGYSLNYVAVAPASADYSVEADVHVQSLVATDMVGVVGRLDTVGNNYYLARWEEATNTWNIVQVAGGVVTSLGSLTAQPDLLVGHNYRLRLEMSGTTTTTLKLLVNGVLKVTATDTTAPFTSAGRGGILDGNAADTTTVKSDTTGLHLDNFQITVATYPRAADSKGTNTGDYENGPVLGQPGALAGDAGTSARFDGINDHVQVTNSTGLPVGATARSVEAWFKTSSTARQVLFAYGSRANTQEYVLWLDAGGGSMTAWGFGTGNDKTFTLPSAVNNGAWHHVVLTYDGSSLTLYIDGVALPSQAATRSTVMSTYGFGIGAMIDPSDPTGSGGYFNGWIDEVAFYNVALSSSAVDNHYELGLAVVDVAGPTGGSVDASGLVGTGARYSTSPTLSLVLNGGSDPSGVATTGAQLTRATATLSAGACGTFGGYTLVTGGTDPVSPKSDVVADQACYRYQYTVSDTFQNSTTYTSPDIKVDTTVPGTPALAFSGFTNTYWPGSGTAVFFRSGATSGSFTTTATASDPASGVSSYTFPALGTGWTSTAGALGVRTYNWSGAPALPGTQNITATNNTGRTSANSPFTMTVDNTAPTAGTVTYSDVTTSTTAVSVGFTTGTESGSGIKTRLLQRASATLTGTTCGTYGAFTTITGGTNPATSPVTDTVARGNCYQYQYVVTDNVGNQHTATSASIVKVSSGYSAAVTATAGLLNYWRLGETTISADSMTGTAAATLQSRPGETAATWTKHALSGDDAVITAAGRVRKGGTATTGALYYTSGVPASANYVVGVDVYVASNLANDMAGVVGRLDPAIATGTFYHARYEQTSQAWALYKTVNGTQTLLGQSAAQALTVGATYRLGLDMTGTNIRVVVNGVQQVSVTDAAITAAGRGGLRLGFGAAGTSVTDTTGLHLDSFKVNPQLADSKSANHADCFGGATLGVAGALVGDSNQAAQFDGVNDFASAPRQISDDFSIEFWFKSTQGIGIGTNWWEGAGLVDASVSGAANDFGVSLRSDGKIVAGVGTPDVSIVSTAGGYNNGVWHHVVFTRVRSTGALALYVDGSLAGTATGNTLALTSATVVNLGRIMSGGNHFLGTLDEVAIYNVALPAATVSAHRAEGLA